MNPNHTIAGLLQGFSAEELSQIEARERAIAVSGVTSDSRAVKPGTCFVAVRGGTSDGHRFVRDARQAGAALIVGEDEKPEGLGVPYLRVVDSRLALARLAAAFHGHPSHRMTVIGVTGTSGKTTTTYLIEAILKAAGHEVGVIGTVNFRHGTKLYPSTHTTPGPVELQELLARMRADGCTAVVMEVSSHALKQHRAAFIAFDAMVFTNLSPEHLDFHPDMEDYYQAKARLFREHVDYAVGLYKRPFAAINADDEYGKRLAGELRAREGADLRFATFGMAEADLSGAALGIDLSGIHGEAGGVKVATHLTGRFNAYNVLAALAVGQGLGIDPETLGRAIGSIKTVPGRLERVPDSRGIHVLVDYAHKPDALEKVLRTLREVRGGHRLITVFGCGGDRDRKKRPVMGKYAVELSDHVWITSDNPRTEDPDAIIREILAGTQGHSNFQVEADRRNAIQGAIRMAKPGDIVVIAGKGHEDYQIIADASAPGGTRKIHFDDREVAAEALATASVKHP